MWLVLWGGLLRDGAGGRARVLGEGFEVRDIRFEQRCCWMSRPRSAPRRRCGHRASSTSPWRPIRAANKRGKLPQSYMPQRRSSLLRRTCPRCLPRTRAARTAPRCASASTSVVFSTVRRSPVSPRVHTGEGSTAPCWLRSRYRAKSARNKMPTACTRRCWMPVFSPLRPHPEVQALGEDVLALPLGIRRPALRCCPQRPLLLHTGDESRYPGRGRPRRARRARAVLLAVQGLRLGTGTSENGHNDRLLAKRLLTIEWRQRELPEVEHADAGTGC